MRKGVILLMMSFFVLTASADDSNTYVENNIAGNLSNVVGTDVTGLTITGELNGTDINFLRTLINEHSLTSMDFSGARIVEGGEAYVVEGNTHNTENDVFGDDMFRGCQNLSSITLPSTITTIGCMALRGTSISSLTIPASVTSISMREEDNGIVEDCALLTEVNVEVGNPYYYSVDNVVFTEREDLVGEGGKALVMFPPGIGGSYIVPSDVTFICQRAFVSCNKLTYIILPEGLTGIGHTAFWGCSALTSITIPEGVTNIGHRAFVECNFSSVTVKNCTPVSIEPGVFTCYDNATLFVPIGYKSAYQTADNWSNFGVIDESADPSTIISFVDANVKALCLVNWDTNGDGELSYTEAAAVTDLGEVFKGNTEITSFDELAYFTGLTSIADNAFNGCNGLTSVTFPNSLTGIGSSAFRGCTSLTSVTIPNSVTNIDTNPFEKCSGLIAIAVEEGNVNYDSRNNCNAIIETVTNKLVSGCKNTIIPEGITTIGGWAFSFCTDLTSMTIPDGVTDIQIAAFENCYALTSVAIPHGVTNIGGYAFSYCNNLPSVNIPNSVTSIGILAFNNCHSLTSIVIPNSVTSIGEAVFQDCNNLTTVNVDIDNPLTIDANVFSNRANATLYVPYGCSGAYEGAAYWQEFMEIVEMTPPSPNIEFADAAVKALCVANWDTNHDGELSEAEAAAVTTLGEVFKENTEITSFDELAYFTGLTSIGYSAFYNCSGLTSLTIPEGVTSIGYAAFFDCSGLTSINVATSNTVYDSRGNCNAIIEKASNTLIAGCKNTVIPEGVTSIGYDAFYGCSGLTSLTIPEGVTSIGNSAFMGCRGLTSLTIPNSVTSIGNSAFAYCSGLTSVTIPNSVTAIGKWAFRGCSGLTSVNIPNSVTSIDNEAFSYCSHLTSIIVESGNTVYDSRNNCNAIITTETNELIAGCKNTTIPNSVTAIGNGAFYDCSGLTSVTIPNSVTDIGNSAFDGCSGLTSVTIPNSVTAIGDRAFAGCSGLTSVTIPNSVTAIGNTAFSFCRHLTSIIVESGNTVYDSRNNCNAIITTETNELIAGCENTTIPNSVTSIGNHAFYGCSGLTSVTIPNSVTAIREFAFFGCSGLTSVKAMMETPMGIGPHTFSYRTNATLYVPYGCSGAYEGAAYWQEFMEIVEMPAPLADIEEDIYCLKNVETGKYLNAGNKWGTHAVLADEPLPARISKQPDGSYTIFFPVGSKEQQLLFRASMEDVYVDYNGQEDGCPYWTITDIGNGNYHIQSLTTNETYGQEAMPGTYLGNDPDKEATNQDGDALGVYNDVDGNVTEGMNITWTLEPLPARTEAQVSQLQELVTTAQGLGLDTSEAEAVLNNNEATSLDMLLAIIDLQQRIDRISKKLSDLTMLITCANAVGVNTDEAQAVADNPSSVDAVTNAINTLREAYIAKLGEGVSSSLLPLNVTGVILNPSFVMDNADGWSCDNGAPKFQSYNNAEYYEKTFDIHQTISGLPNGNYVLKVKGYHRPGASQDVYSDYQQGIDNASAELYANGEAVILNNQASGAQETQLISNDDEWRIVSYNDVTKYVPISMHGARFAFDAGLYENELPFTVTDGTLTLGIRLEESVDYGWVIFDDFRLEYLGETLSGDANGDGDVNVTDYMAIANYILGTNTTNFDVAAADVNGDNDINVSDYVGVANIILYGNWQGSSVNGSRAMGAEETSPWMEIGLSEDGKMNLLLRNTKPFSAFQMDIRLPEGMEIADANMAKANQTKNLGFSRLQDGTWRLLYGTLENKTVNLADDNLLTLELASSNSHIGGLVTIDNIFLANRDASAVRLNAVQSGLPTGIYSIESGTSISGDCYDLTGRKVDNSQLNKGVYIVKGKKIFVK